MSRITNQMVARSILQDLNARAYDRCIPLNVTLELTLRCNIRCTHCYNFDRDQPRPVVGSPSRHGEGNRAGGADCGASVIDQPVFSLGAAASRCAMMVFMSSVACSSDTPSRNRASPCELPRPGEARRRSIFQP